MTRRNSCVSENLGRKSWNTAKNDRPSYVDRGIEILPDALEKRVLPRSL